MDTPAPRDGGSSRWSRALGGIGDAYGDANFRRYSVGSIVSWLSFFVQSVAVAWVAWSLTHSTRWLAAVALLDAVPMSLLAPLGGVLADRHDRFRILMIAYGFATLQSALLAALAFADALTIERLAALALLHGVIHAFSVPAQFGLLPRFVARNRLPSAIAVAAAYTQLGLFVGPALAGWVLLHFSPAVAFATNVAGYGVYFLSAGLMRTPAVYVPPAAVKTKVLPDLVDGVRTILAHRGITALLALMLFGDALKAAVGQMLSAFADRSLGAGVEGFSTLLASGGIGATLSALWLAQGGARRTTTTVITRAFLGYVVATLVFAASPNLGVAALAMAGRGFFFELCRTGMIALLQTSVPDAMRGRLMSTQFLLQQGASAFGVAVIGIVADSWGLRLPFVCGGCVALIAWFVVLAGRDRIAASFARSAEAA